MLCADTFEFVARKGFDGLAGWLKTGGGTKLGNEFIGENERFGFWSGGLRPRIFIGGNLIPAVIDHRYRLGEFLDDINFLWMNCDEQIRR